MAVVSINRLELSIQLTASVQYKRLEPSCIRPLSQNLKHSPQSPATPIFFPSRPSWSFPLNFYQKKTRQIRF